jgi:hypothetical protein
MKAPHKTNAGTTATIHKVILGETTNKEIEQPMICYQEINSEE